MDTDLEPVLCLSHLRWRFVHQRPQHLLSRCARRRPVIFFEEPVFDRDRAELELVADESGVLVAVPHLPPTLEGGALESEQRRLIDQLLGSMGFRRPLLWFYTPMALPLVAHLDACGAVYDCMDELSLFHGAPRDISTRERLLLSCVDVVFTGGQSLYEHKRGLHPNIHPFPSSVDVPHFAQARGGTREPEDQAPLPGPRIGFFGVIDERMDLELVTHVADAARDLHFVMIGPVAKINPSLLPKRPNIHWLGPKSYAELPAYLSGWDAAILPFARNDSTKFISPTKTPEYLAAGVPVISTSIRDVVNPYGQLGLAWIADEPADFLMAIRRALASDREAHLARSDAFLSGLSWDLTFERMWKHVEQAVAQRRQRSARIASSVDVAAAEE